MTFVLPTEEFLQRTSLFIQWSDALVLYTKRKESFGKKMLEQRDAVKKLQDELLLRMHKISETVMQNRPLSTNIRIIGYYNKYEFASWNQQTGHFVVYEKQESTVKCTDNSFNDIGKLKACKTLFGNLIISYFGKGDLMSNEVDICMTNAYNDLKCAFSKLNQTLDGLSMFNLTHLNATSETMISNFNRDLKPNELRATPENLEWMIACSQLSFEVREIELRAILYIPVIDVNVNWSLWRERVAENFLVSYGGRSVKIDLPKDLVNTLRNDTYIVKYENKKIKRLYNPEAPYVVGNGSVFYYGLSVTDLSNTCIPLIAMYRTPKLMRIVIGPGRDRFYIDEEQTQLCSMNRKRLLERWQESFDSTSVSSITECDGFKMIPFKDCE